jgi:hypothetical protein
MLLPSKYVGYLSYQTNYDRLIPLEQRIWHRTTPQRGKTSQKATISNLPPLLLPYAQINIEMKSQSSRLLFGRQTGRDFS